MNEARGREEFAQSADSEGVFRCAIDPARLGVGLVARDLESRVILRIGGIRPLSATIFKRFPMAHNGSVDTTADFVHEVIALHAHGGKLRAFPAGGSAAERHGQVDGKRGHPVRFLEAKEVRMLPQTPGQNARAGTR